MGIFSFFKSTKQFFSDDEKQKIINAIQASEKTTSGEIRMFVESRNSFVDPLDRASEIFFKLKMEHTRHRNAVLLYIAMDSHELALFADEGIFREVGEEYWNVAVRNMLAQFTKDKICDGVVQCIRQIGATLTAKFPYVASEDKNELPDEIIFGK